MRYLSDFPQHTDGPADAVVLDDQGFGNTLQKLISYSTFYRYKCDPLQQNVPYVPK